jgi:hypothetical protein
MFAQIIFGLTMIYKNIPQNIVSWILWTAMDLLMTATMFFAGSKGSWRLPAGYTIGAAFVTLVLIFKGNWQWGAIETMSIVGVAISLLVWKFAGAKTGVVASVLAMTIASFPAVCQAWNTPDINTCWYWATATGACVFSIAGAKAWTIEERLFPVNSFFFQAMMALLALR